MAKLSREELLTELAWFTGSTQLYYHPLFKAYKYTDGVRFLAQNAGAYWLLEYILSNQTLPVLKNETFQVWKMKVVNSSAIIKVEDGNSNVLKDFKISFTDFPLKEITFWIEGDTLLLPSEH